MFRNNIAIMFKRCREYREKQLPGRSSMGVSSAPKLSGMQRQVLSLYRAFLRAARSKSAEDRRQIESVVSAEFRRNAKLIDRKNFIYIEYLLRRGNKQLDQLRSPATVGLSSLTLNSSPTQDSEP
ncbi:succinate dehydrogenase assembly factor 1, mitochondrial [Cucurbita pepo subsp. pepo]|uniref:succinate dehydrogenase assembly factor 1, mitochondrial n=1 Tax=Cucurbita pepo subsp. pepo TaxID=3664 RepID=UPI000C9D4379|nr:succinate dehydrogenase assembly factor 1, mitochondrial [Cucurbita pepo subsp. pepo]XP_023525065.1 succinate dehydrogenase assembly factor 1, mitochondrial [Cucurbita pepo subsp. pepo]